jgi:hypothetical protein
MPRDALDPGPDGTYPAWPRKSDGSPDPERMPTGRHRQKVPDSDRRVLTDQTPRKPTGEPIVPPTIPPEGG